jgi:GH24 family phage-related lysozyme (muramidase)
LVFLEEAGRTLKEKVDCGGLNFAGFFKGLLELFFLDGIGHWTIGKGRTSHVNQLSETKIYPQSNVDKSSTHRF